MKIKRQTNYARSVISSSYESLPMEGKQDSLGEFDILKLATMATALSSFVKNGGELRFAFIQVTTRCNAKCLDRCNIWASAPVDVSLEDVTFAIDVLAKNGFSIVYFTGGETGLYPYLIEAVEYAKKKGMITSITTNGTISADDVRRLSPSLDMLSVSVDHYDDRTWDSAKHVVGISKKARETIGVAKALGMRLYAITFLNPSWSVDEVEKIVRYVNEDLGVSFAMSYPYISSNDGTFKVGGKLRDSNYEARMNVRNMVAKVLQLKLEGPDVATVSGYMRDVLRAHDGLPMRYQCNAGKSVITIDCNLNVFPCYKRTKMFNLREQQDLTTIIPDNSKCDNKYCMINCFKEASLGARETCLSAVKEEFFSNPKFYFKLIK
jgi:MoaA/NifB/PqqE/SkfB family radical SAM enzyme